MNPYGILHSAPNSLSLHDHNQLSRMLQIPVVPQQMVVTPSITNSAMRALGSLGQDSPHMNGLASLGNPAHEHVNRMVMNQGGLEQRHRPNTSSAAPGTSSSGGPSGNPPDSGGGNMHRQQNPSSVQDHRLTINQPNLDQRHHKQLNTPSTENSRQDHHHPQQQHPPNTTNTPSLDLHQEVMMENYYEEADDRPHVCQVCNACYKTRTHLKRHMCIHLKARPYSCTFPECGKGFNRKGTEHANKHYDAVHRLSKFKCTYCSKEISRKDHLNRHIKNMHTFPLPPGGTRRAAGTGARKKKGEGGAKLGNVLAVGLIEPKTELGNSRCQQLDPHAILGPSVPHPHYQTAQFTNGKPSAGVSGLLELFTCPECSSSFVSENDLTIHAKTHKPQPYKCTECSRAYTRREKLTEHVRCFHQGQKFSCEYCGKDLSRKDHVLRHVRSVHPEVLASQFVEMAESNGIDPASVISARANSNGSNNSHLPTSSASTTSTPTNNSNSNAIPSMGEMGALLKSVCHICLKVFGTSYHLSRHVQSVHNQNMRPYACSFCSKQFKRKDHLTNHTKSHCNSHREGSPSSAQLNMANIINGAESLRHHALNSLQIEMLAPDEENKNVQQNDLQKGSENAAKGSRAGDGKYPKTEKLDARETCDAMGMTSSAAQAKRGKSGVQERNNDGNGSNNSRPLTESVRTETQQLLPFCAQCQIKFSSDGQLVHHLIQKHGGGGQEASLVKDTFQQSLWGRMESVESSGGEHQHATSSRS